MPFFKEDGQVAVIVAIIIIVLIGMVVLVVDVGSLYEDRRQLQTVADAAALAGAQDLPEDPVNAVQKAVDYANSNGVAITSSDVQISTTLVDNDTITVTPDRNAKLYFAPVLGVNSASVSATATATANGPLGMSGLVPWGVLEDDTITPGDPKVMKVASWDKLEPGFFGAMHFEHEGVPGGGAKLYEENIVSGCTEWIFTGKYYPIEPGNMAGPTDKGVDTRIDDDIHTFAPPIVLLNDAGEYVGHDATCPRIVIVPVIDAFPENPSDDVLVVNFGVFFIESIDVEGKGGNAEASVSGRFVKYMIAVSSSETTGYTGGIKVIRLVK